MTGIEAALAVPGWMDPSELAWLAERAGSVQVIVEVGAWKGRATMALAEHAKGRVYAVDHWRGSDPEHLEEIARRGPDSVYDDFRSNLAGHIGSGRLRTLRMDAFEAAAWLSVAEGVVDFVFIDAGHGYEECLRDIQCFRSLVRAGGIIAGHDYLNPQFPGVTRAVDEAFGAVHRAGLSIWWAWV